MSEISRRVEIQNEEISLENLVCMSKQQMQVMKGSVKEKNQIQTDMPKYMGYVRTIVQDHLQPIEVLQLGVTLILQVGKKTLKDVELNSCSVP